ncbi:hypothetical protein ACP140_07575 [Staphylococcus haemolyticus]
MLDNAGAICRIEQGQTTNLQTPYLDKMNRLKEDLKQAQVKEFNDKQVEKLRREIQQLEKTIHVR